MAVLGAKLKKVAFIGAGGIGGYAIPAILQLVSTNNTLKSLEFYIIDNDIVEEKNIVRQNFIYNDVGQPKAKIMAIRYGSIYNVNVKYIVERFDPNETTFKSLFGTNTLIIDMVDNINTRFNIDRAISRAFKYSNMAWISAGNGTDDGQAIFNYDAMGYTKTIVNLFPHQFTLEMLEAERLEEERANCAINAISKPQTMAINRMAAINVVNMFYQLFFEETMKYDFIEFDRFGTSRGYKKDEQLLDLSKIDFKDLQKQFAKLKAS